MRTRWTNWLFLILLWPAALAQLVESGLDRDETGTSISPADRRDLMNIMPTLGFRSGQELVKGLAIMAVQSSAEECSLLAWIRPVSALGLDDGHILELMPDTCASVNRRVELLLDPEGKPHAETLMRQLTRITGQSFATPEEWTRWWDGHWRIFPAPVQPETVKDRLAAFQARVERAKAPWPAGYTVAELEDLSRVNPRIGLMATAFSSITLNPPQTRERQAQLEAALREYHDGNSAETERLLTTYLTSHPRDLHALLFRAHARTDQRKVRESLEDLDAVRLLLGEIQMTRELRRLNARLVDHPDFSLLQAWRDQVEEDETASGTERMRLPDLRSDYTHGSGKFGLAGPGDPELLAMANAARKQPLVELGLLMMLKEPSAALEDFTRRQPEVTEGWVALLLLANANEELQERALKEIRRQHPEDALFRLLEASHAERDGFWSMKPNPQELKLSRASRRLLHTESRKMVFPAGPAARLLEVRLMAAEAGKQRGGLWISDSTSLVKAGGPFSGIQRSQFAWPLTAEFTPPKRNEADLRLIAEAHLQAAQLVMDLSEASMLQAAFATDVGLLGKSAELAIEMKRGEKPQAELVNQHTAYVEPLISIIMKGMPPPLPSLAREWIKELQSPPAKPK